MKYFVLLSTLIVCGCASPRVTVRPVPADTLSRMTATQERPSPESGVRTYVFPGPPIGIEEEASVALKACLYTRRVFLQNGKLGSDGTYDYALFFAGWEIDTGFEGVYYKYVVFAKRKADRSWADSRVFIAPKDYAQPFADPFDGPLSDLSAAGEELMKKEPNKAPEPTPTSVTPPANVPKSE